MGECRHVIGPLTATAGAGRLLAEEASKRPHHSTFQLQAASHILPPPTTTAFTTTHCQTSVT